MRASEVQRVGSTARRPAHARTPLVLELLGHLRREGFSGAPAPCGIDEQGRQCVEWIPGDVPPGSPFRLPPSAIAAAGALIRAFHDAAARFPGLGDAETIVHGDLGPHNTVFRAGLPVAIIDWDEDVRPGSRIDDVAHAAWCFADLLEEAVAPARQRDGLHLFCRAYGGVDAVHSAPDTVARPDQSPEMSGRTGLMSPSAPLQPADLRGSGRSPGIGQGCEGVRSRWLRERRPRSRCHWV